MDDQPPPPQTCVVRGCNYNTPIGVPTWEVVLGLMQAHNQQVHPPPPPAQPVQGGPACVDGAGGGAGGAVGKLDKRPRPQASTDMTEHNFKFFEN